MENGSSVECRGLRRVYSSRTLAGRQEVVALDNLDLLIPRGLVFGLLGPNGAGKTTTVRILSTLLLPSGGQANVFGMDVVREASQVRRRIGLILGGERGLYGRLTARENLEYFGALYRLSSLVTKRRTDELLSLVGLEEAAGRLVEQFSRGMKQRLHIARGLLADPDLIFMDEPTIGLDPVIAQEVREIIPKLAQAGKTILLTTHYMAEADQLCERVAIINHGRIVAQGTPIEIKRRFSRIATIELALKRPLADAQSILSKLDGIERVAVSSDGPYQRVTVLANHGPNVAAPIRSAIGSENIEWLIEREPSLEDAYLSILRTEAAGASLT